MLCLWIFLFSTSETFAQSAKEDDYRCIIPERDVVKNGNFTVYDWMGSTWEGKDPPPAGTKLLTYDLEFQCDSGFFLRGNQNVRCVPLQVDDFPVCSDTCEPSDPDCPAQSDGISTNLDRFPDSGECGIVAVAPTALAGGRTAIPGDMPWQAAIYDKSTDPFMQICGGSIVSKDVVISAAHCFKLPDEFYAVAVGKIYRPYNNPLDGHAQKSDVLEIRIPPRYRGSVTSFQDDIAAVILATPIQFTNMIHPVCLHFGADFDEVQLASGTLGRVAGWGIDSRNGRPSQVLNLAEMPIVDVGTCFMLQDVSFIQYITSDKFCAGYTNGTSLCKGDSGGGLAVPHKTGFVTRYYLRGVVSTGPPPATLNECNVNAVTTFTRVAKHEHFVKSAIAKKPLQESERRIPLLIPANYINTNPNRIGNNGVNEGVPLRVDHVNKGIFTNQEPIFGNGGNLQKGAPGSVVIIPDTVIINGDGITQTPPRENPKEANSFINNYERSIIIGSFPNSRDLQAKAPGTVVVLPDKLTTSVDGNTQVSLTDNAVQTNNFINERPISGNFPDSRDIQANAPGTVVVKPDTLNINEDVSTQIPISDDAVQTTNLITERPIIGNFGNSKKPQAGAPGTVVFIPNTLTIDVNRNTEDPLREDAVQPVGIFDNQRSVFNSSLDPNVTVADNPETVTNNGNNNDEIPVKESVIPKPIAELDNDSQVFTDLNDRKPLLISTHKPTVPLTDKIEVISEGFPTTPNPQLNQGAPDYFNYQWPSFPQAPYQYKPNQNWYYPSQNGYYPNQNVHYANPNVQSPSQNGHYRSQSRNFPSPDGQSNGYFGHDWHYNNPVWNSYNQPWLS